MYESLLENIRCVYAKAVPKKIINKENVNVPEYLQKFCKIVEQSYEKVSESRCLCDYIEYVKLCRRYRKKLQKFRSNAEFQALKKVGNSKYSKFAKNMLKPRKIEVPTFSDDHGNISRSDQQKAEALASSFEAQFINVRANSFTTTHASSDQTIPWVTDNEVLAKINKSKKSCSMTADKVPFTFIKYIAPFICSGLAQIFNLSMMRGELPKAWKKSIVVPLNKKAKPKEPLDFRPISLTSHLCRIYERCLLSKILPVLEDLEFWSASQHGFRAKKSTVTNLLECMNDWTEYLDTKKQVDIIYLDFAKAFDRVDHELLMRKLENLKLNNHLLEWINEFLTGRSFRVKVGDALSQEKMVYCGVPQGSVLSPVLFGIYVNDISSKLPPGVKCKQFADDTKIYTCTSEGDINNNLQEAIDYIVKWSETEKLALNNSKTVHLTLTLGRKTRVFDYFINGTPIKKENVTRDLGFLISSKLDFSEHWKKA
ncbi:hypothetical protein CAEBREN_30708, partial [Caenorhabditis brenneri]